MLGLSINNLHKGAYIIHVTLKWEILILLTCSQPDITPIRSPPTQPPTLDQDNPPPLV